MANQDTKQSSRGNMRNVGLLAIIALAATQATAGQSKDEVACDSKDPSVRIAACTRLLQSGGDDVMPAAYSGRADGYLALGDTARAIADYRRAISLFPAYAYYHVKLGRALDQAGDRASATDSFKKAIELDPKYLSGYDNLATEYIKDGKYELAVQEFDLAISQDKSNPNAYNDRGYTYFQMGLVDYAISDYTTALALDPRLVVALNNRAWALHTRHEDSKALVDAEAAFKIGPGFTDSSRIRAAIYEALGRKSDAIEAYRNTLRLDPNNDLAKQGLARLGARP
jgi:tetratricopeptide (TPR) repeat protein